MKAIFTGSDKILKSEEVYEIELWQSNCPLCIRIKGENLEDLYKHYASLEEFFGNWRFYKGMVDIVI